MRIRIYPTPEQEEALLEPQPSLRAAWNWLATRQNDVKRAYEARAIRDGLVGPRIPRPDYDGLSPSAAQDAASTHRSACAERQRRIHETIPRDAWRPSLAAKPGVGSEATRLGVKHDYQVLNWYLRACGLQELSAHVLQALAKNFYRRAEGQRAKRPKKPHEMMPIQVRSGGRMLHWGAPKDAPPDWGRRRNNPTYYNGYVAWGRQKIRARLDPGLINMMLEPGFVVREGVTIRLLADGWYASVTRWQRLPIVPSPGDGSLVGIDPGLDKLAVFSERMFVASAMPGPPVAEPLLPPIRNTRNLAHADQIAGMQSRAEAMDPGRSKTLLQTRISRHHQTARRRTLHTLYTMANQIAPLVEFVGVEHNSGCAIGIGSRYTSTTKTMVSVLSDKLGEARVREVDSYKNSQRCSQCGFESKIAWERRLGHRDQTCTCPRCMYRADRDLNSARTVGHKAAEALRNQET